MNDPKRQEIKDRIASGQQRQLARGGSGEDYDQARDDNGFIAFAKEHPLLTVAGGLAVGVLVAGMFPSARGVARKGGAKASALGAAGTQAAVIAFQHLLDGALEASRAGSETLTDVGDTIGDTARGAKREALHLADRSGDNARIATRNASKTLSRSLQRFWR